MFVLLQLTNFFFIHWPWMRQGLENLDHAPKLTREDARKYCEKYVWQPHALFKKMIQINFKSFHFTLLDIPSIAISSMHAFGFDRRSHGRIDRFCYHSPAL